MRTTILLLAFLCAACSSSLPSLSPYRMDIQQGNVVTPKMMMQLRPGMSKAQVRFVMGTPLLVDSFHSNRWDYFYQMRKDGKIIEQRNVVLEFENDKLKTVRGDVIPATADAKDAKDVKDLKASPAAAPLPLPSFNKPGEPVKPPAQPEVAPSKPAAPAPKAEPQAVPAEPAKPEPKAVPQPETHAAPVDTPKPEAAKPVPAPAPKPEAAKPASAPKAEPQPAPVAVPKSEPKPAPKSAAKPEPKPAPKPEDDLPPEEDPSYFERMLEKIGF